MLLCLCLLSVFALPMETAAHTLHRIDKHYEAPQNRVDEDTFDYDDPSHVDFANVIEWVRVYKNPRTTLGSELPSPGNVFNQAGYPVRRAPGVATGLSYLLPSQHGEDLDPMWNPQTAIWVDFDVVDGDGSLFEDPAKEGESGLVTADKNTTVKPGDRVAIAVKFTSWGGEVKTDLTIGPRLDITYDYSSNEQVWSEELMRNVAGTVQRSLTHREGPWRLNPNLLLQPRLYVGGTLNLQNQAGKEHVLVYQFVVDEEHAILNAEGPWLKQDFVTEFQSILDDELLPPARGRLSWTDNQGSAHPTRFEHFQGVDWLYGAVPDKAHPNRADYPSAISPNILADRSPRWVAYDDTTPSATAVKVWNTFLPNDIYKTNWESKADNEGVDGWTQHKRNNDLDFTVGHRHIPLYDPAEKELIYYPKVVVGDTDVTTVSTATAITNVPSGTQTGAFQVTLAFSEVQEIADFTVERVIHQSTGAKGDILVPGASVSIFVAHNVSEAGVAASQKSLIAALAAAEQPWTVTEMAYAGGIQIASLEGHGTATRYTVTLSPPLNVKGDIALQIPADAVLDVIGNGHTASETVMVSVDTKTALPLAVVDAPEVVLGTGEVTVSVPFAQDGLTYEGDNPPYLTIYLGDEVPANARHAVWQSESPGSTIVSFVYRGDDIGGLVSADMASLAIPKGTTLVVSDSLRQAGRAPVASGPEEVARSSPDMPMLSIVARSGAALSPVQFIPWLPTEESEPKSAASSVPRTPIVFNELGNGSGADNDWLELRNVTDASVSLKDWELSVVADAKQEDTSLVVFPDVSVPANGLLLLTNQPSDKTPLAGGDDVAAAGSDKRRKGLTHLSLVNAGLSLPDDGKFLLILRNAKEKRGLNEAFVDVAGGGGSSTDAFIRDQTGLYDTHVWPLQVLEAPGSDTEDSLSAGKVWLRAKADIVGYHRDAWAEAAFSGLGYDRKVSKSAETAGTPGYPNGAVKTQPATPKGAVTMSEVMFDSAGGTLPQWIELYNTSKTEALNLNRWELEIQNRKSEDLVGRPVVTLTLQEKVIQPNQTLLIVTGNARASSADVFPSDRVYNLIQLHEKNLRIKTPRDTFLSTEGFYLKLTDSTGALVDEIGNTDGDRRTDDTPAWALPVPLSEVEGMRSSLVRRYDNGVAREGTSREGWALAANFKQFKADGLHYGHADDIGTPGYRQGGALPVELSSFTLTRTDSGAVVVTWTTESEVDNAGFNLRRSLTRDSGYTLLNPALIAGAGTTGERQTYTFIDTSAKPGVEHYYQIEEVSFGGKPETLVTRRLRGPVSPAHRALKTLGEVKQAK